MKLTDSSNKFQRVTFEEVAKYLKKNLYIEDEWSLVDIENSVFEWWPWNFKIKVDVQSEGEYEDGSEDNWIKIRATVVVGECAEEIGNELVGYINHTFPFGVVSYKEGLLSLSNSVILNPLNREVLGWFRLAIMGMVAETVRFQNPEVRESAFNPLYSPHPVSGHRDEPDEMAQIFFFEETTAMNPYMNIIEILQANKSAYVDLLKDFNYELVSTDPNFDELYSNGISIFLIVEEETPWAKRFGPGLRLVAVLPPSIEKPDFETLNHWNIRMLDSMDKGISTIKSLISFESELFISTFIPAAFIAENSHSNLAISISNFVSQVRNNAAFMANLISEEGGLNG
jgi:hypothetical protein